MGNLGALIQSISDTYRAVAPAVQSVIDLSKKVTGKGGGSSSKSVATQPTAGTYAGNKMQEFFQYKIFGVIPTWVALAAGAGVVLFWKKIKRMFR